MNTEPSLWPLPPEPAAQTPHCCPVCMGKGIVASGFYLHPPGVIGYVLCSTTPEICRSCNGRGIILT